MRDELLELRPFTFISEIRYRELKQRWGQVFRADMGAEAFYDVLERLDLALDEVVQLLEVVGQFLGQIEIHDALRSEQRSTFSWFRFC